MTQASRVASLGMYDFPWLEAAHDALWDAVAEGLRAAGLAGVPPHLDRTRAMDAIWQDQRLLLAQACGLPIVTTLAGRVRVVAAPRYALPGCDGAWHRSFVVVRADDDVATLAGLRGRGCAINGRDSNTGMNLLRATLAPLAHGAAFFGAVVETGAHRESLRAVAQGRADVAAIDCVTHGLLARHEPGLLRGTRVLGWTPASPALPLVTGVATPDTEVKRLRAVLCDPALAPCWAAVGVGDVVAAEADMYRPVSAVAMAAAAAGYPHLI